VRRDFTLHKKIISLSLSLLEFIDEVSNTGLSVGSSKMEARQICLVKWARGRILVPGRK